MSSIDWPGLLKWSLQYSDGTSPQSRISPEDAAFLEAAVRYALDNTEDPSKLVTEALDKLRDPDDSQVIAALSVIERCVDEHPEVSRNLDKLSAISPLLNAMFHKNQDAVEISLKIFGFALPHNPAIQEAVARHNGLDLLCDRMSNAPSTTIAVKALGALSGLIRHHVETEKEFVRKGGTACLIQAMRSSEPKYQEKAASLMFHLVEEGRMTSEEIETHRLYSGIDSLLASRNIEKTGVQYGERAVQLVLSILRRFRPQLAKSGSLFAIQVSLQGRLRFIENLQNTDSPDDVSSELSLLQEALKLCK